MPCIGYIHHQYICHTIRSLNNTPILRLFASMRTWRLRRTFIFRLYLITGSYRNYCCNNCHNSGHYLFKVKHLIAKPHYGKSDMIAPFYKGYSHMTVALSSLGKVNSPVRILYNSWMLAAGVLFFLSISALFEGFRKSSFGLSLICTICIAILLLEPVFSPAFLV